MNEGWHLIDGEESNKQFPDTFHIPPRAEREGLLVDRAVKIGVKSEDKDVGGERFWVVIEQVENGRYRGQIANNLVQVKSHGLKAEDTIEFGPEHILATTPPPPYANPTATVEDLWLAYQVAILPTLPQDPESYEILRKSFFAGFLNCFMLIKTQVAKLEPEQAQTRFDWLEKELFTFAQAQIDGATDELEAQKEKTEGES